MDDAPAAAPAPSPVSTLSLDYDRRMASNMLSQVNEEHDDSLKKRQWREPEPHPPRTKKNKKNKSQVSTTLSSIATLQQSMLTLFLIVHYCRCRRRCSHSRRCCCCCSCSCPELFELAAERENEWRILEIQYK